MTTRPPFIQWLKRIVAISFLLLSTCVAYTSLQMQRAGRMDETRKTDVILVLGMRVLPHEKPSPMLAARIQHAIALYKKGYAKHLIVSGGTGKYPPSEAEMMRRIAVKNGVPDKALFLEVRSHNTEQNFLFSKKIMDSHRWRTALVVSDAFHFRRAMSMAKDAGMEAYQSPVVNSPARTNFCLKLYYTSREILATWWYGLSKIFAARCPCKLRGFGQ